MKRKILTVAAVLFAVAAIEGHTLGLGVQLNGNYYADAFGYGASLLVSPHERAHIAVDWYLDNVLQLGGSFDYWFLTVDLAGVGSGSLNFYLGVGLYAWLAMWSDGMGLSVGPRVPIGLDLAFSYVDIFLQVVPQFGVNLLPGFGVGGIRPAVNLGFRFWLDGHNGF
jgi:hypothetical protein